MKMKVGYCTGCRMEWTQLALCHCADCHSFFHSVRSFDAHRPMGKCEDPSRCLMVRDNRGVIAWGKPGEGRPISDVQP